MNRYNKNLKYIVPIVFVLLLLVQLSNAQTSESTQIKLSDKPIMIGQINTNLTQNAQKGDSPISTSATSGSVTILVNNTRLSWAPSGSFDISVTIPDGQVISELNLEMTYANASNHVYRGAYGGTGSTPTQVYPGGTLVDSVGTKVYVGHRVVLAGAYIYLQYLDNISLGAPSTLSVDLLTNNATGYPDLIIAQNNSEFNDWILPGYVYRYYTFPRINISLVDDAWLAYNGSALNGTDAEADSVRSVPYFNTAADGWTTKHQAGTWVAPGAYWSYHMYLIARRINLNNESWEAPSAESLNLMATVAECGVSDSFSGNSTTLCTFSDLTVTLSSNISALVSLDWNARLGPAPKNRERPDASYPEGRYPDHLDTKPYGYIWEPTTFLERYGWYVFIGLILLTLTILVGVLKCKCVALIGLALLVLYVSSIIYLCTSGPDSFDDCGWYIFLIGIFLTISLVLGTFRCKYVFLFGAILTGLFGLMSYIAPQALDPFINLVDYALGWAEWHMWPTHKANLDVWWVNGLEYWANWRVARWNDWVNGWISIGNWFVARWNDFVNFLMNLWEARRFWEA